MLNQKELNDLRIYLGRVCNIPSNSIILNQHGRFEIYQVKETDKDMIVNKLRRDIKVNNVFASPSGYDLGHFKYPGMPLRKYTITGNVNTEPENIDDDTSTILY